MPRSESPLFAEELENQENDNKFPFFNHTSPLQPQPQRLVRNPTLAELLRRRRVDDDVAIELDPIRPPFVLTFADLTYSVKLRRGISGDRKVLLRGISGEAREGEITAVMGQSGSGKSTLIDALAHRISRESLRGTVQLSGRHVDSRLSKAVSGYVMQDDLLFPMLTVQETLMFAAEFRLPRSLSRRDKLARVQTLITQLGLTGAANTVVGDELRRGVSGGERRRVSIGADVIHHPLLLFLDEPTSGLDSTSAFMLVKVLKRIALAGSVVVMSIHQPSSRIIGLIDRLIFLSSGAAVYAGPPSNLPAFFRDFGRPIPHDETADNRTEFALDLIRDLDHQTLSSLVEFNTTWQKHDNKLVVKTGEEEETQRVMEERISSLTSMSSSFTNPWWAEMAVLARRTITNSRRMPEEFGVRLGAVVVTGGILATVFWKLDKSPKGIEERVGLFAFAMSTTFYTCAEAIPAFLQERYIFMRETAYNAYRRSSYVVAHSLTAIPALLFLSLTFAATTFWATGLAGGFHLYFLAILASFWAGSSFVTFLSGVVTNVMLGYTVVVAVLAYFLLFSGFFITSDRIPVYWLWFHYLSLVKYPYQAVLRNEFDHVDKCFVTGIQIFDNTPLAAVSEALKGRMLESMSRTLGVNITASTCVTTGPDILQQQGVTGLSMWACIGITIAWGFFFRILFYFTLLLGSKNKRT